jgi:hypothetical protein
MSTRLRLGIAALALTAAVAPATSAFGVPISLDRTAVVGSHASGPMVFRPTVTAAAWFQPDPLCGTPLGCGFLKLPTLNPYPKGTFHIGTAIGRQIARAFIAVHVSDTAAEATAGTLSIPLDTNPADGSIAPQTANINVCVVYQAVTDIEGAFDGAPSANCLPAAHAKYVAKPRPHLVANLERLVGHLAGVKGFALLPADAAPTAAWSVVFKLPTGRVAATSLPQVKLVIGKIGSVSPNPRTTHHHSTGSEATGGGDGSVIEPEPTLPPAVSVTRPPAPAPVVAGPTKPAGHLVTVAYQYPEVWLLPLVLLVLIPYTLRALTKDLTRRP